MNIKFLGIMAALLAPLPAAAQSAQDAIAMGCYAFHVDLDVCYRYDAVPGKEFSCNLDTYKISTGQLDGRLSYFESCPGAPLPLSRAIRVRPHRELP